MSCLVFSSHILTYSHLIIAPFCEGPLKYPIVSCSQTSSPDHAETIGWDMSGKWLAYAFDCPAWIRQCIRLHVLLQKSFGWAFLEDSESGRKPAGHKPSLCNLAFNISFFFFSVMSTVMFSMLNHSYQSTGNQALMFSVVKLSWRQFDSPCNGEVSSDAF